MRGKVQNWIVSNISRIKLSFIGEDFSREATIQELVAAVNVAQDRDLDLFIRRHVIPVNFDGDYGYIRVTVKRK